MEDNYRNKYWFFLRRLLKRQGLSCWAFTQKHGIPNSTFYAILENKTQYITPETLAKIAGAFGYKGVLEFEQAHDAFTKFGIVVEPKFYDEQPMSIVEIWLLIGGALSLLFLLLYLI